jgi:hypothetical protein
MRMAEEALAAPFCKRRPTPFTCPQSLNHTCFRMPRQAGATGAAK